MRIMGIDYGAVRTGLALSDPTGSIASPAGFIESRSLAKLADELAEKCLESNVGKIVIGLPRHMDGREGDHAPKARELGKLLENKLGLPVIYLDERLTTLTAHQAMNEAGISGKKRKYKIDAASAAVILQNYMDANSPQPL